MAIMGAMEITALDGAGNEINGNKKGKRGAGDTKKQLERRDQIK